MNTAKKILIGIVSLILIAITYYYITEDYWKFDRKYTSQINEFENAHLILKKSNLTDARNHFKNKSSMFPSAGVDLVFSIEKLNDNYIELNLPEIQKLFDNKLVTAIHILFKRRILFQLKWCDRPNCIKDRKGFKGFFTHYLSKDKIHFKNLSYTHVVASKSFGEWTYYIVWCSKG